MKIRNRLLATAPNEHLEVEALARAVRAEPVAQPATIASTRNDVLADRGAMAAGSRGHGGFPWVFAGTCAKLSWYRLEQALKDGLSTK